MGRIYNDITECRKTIVAIAPSSSERYLSIWWFAGVNVESDPIVNELVHA